MNDLTSQKVWKYKIIIVLSLSLVMGCTRCSSNKGVKQGRITERPTPVDSPPNQAEKEATDRPAIKKAEPLAVYEDSTTDGGESSTNNPQPDVEPTYESNDSNNNFDATDQESEMPTDSDFWSSPPEEDWQPTGEGEGEDGGSPEESLPDPAVDN